MNNSKRLQIKRVLKLNDNKKAFRKGEEGCYLSQKFDLTFKLMSHEWNAISKYASSDLTIDEKILAHRGCRPVSDSLMKRIEGKLNVTKVG